MGGSSSAGGVEGSSVAGGSVSVVVGDTGSSVVGDGASVVGASDDDVGSLVVRGVSSAAGGDVPPVLLGVVLVLFGGDVSRSACDASSLVVGEKDLSCAGAETWDEGRAAEAGGAGLVLADRSATILRRLSPTPGILNPASATPPIPPLRCEVSTSVSSSAVTCSSTCSRTPPAARSITSNGEPTGLSESGAIPLRSETNPTAAATTPAPASTYPRLARPSLRTKRLGGANRKAEASVPRPSY